MKTIILILIILLCITPVINAEDCATITLHNNSDNVVDGFVFGIVKGLFVGLMEVELQPGEKFAGAACLPPRIYDVVWIEKNCNADNYEEKGCIFDEYFFAINSGDKIVELVPVGVSGKRVKHIRD